MILNLNTLLKSSLSLLLFVVVNCSSIETKRGELKTKPTTTTKNPPLSAPTAPTAPSATPPPSAPLAVDSELDLDPAVPVQESNGSMFDIFTNEKKIKANYSEEPYTIGLMLPLTGTNERTTGLARNVLRAVQLGLGLNSDRSPFRLAIYDTRADLKVAEEQFDLMIKEEKPIAVLGSILGKDSMLIAQKSQDYLVPSISLSQKSFVTDVGPYVFRNALSSSIQVKTLLDKVMGEMNLRKFALIYPNDAYGIEYANVFWDEVLLRGGEIRAAQVYDPLQTDLRDNIQRLVGQFYVEPRMAEYQKRLRELKLKKKDKSFRENTQEDVLPPMVDFEAVFIPDGPKNFGYVSSFLTGSRIRGVKLLGTNLLNVPKISSRVGKFANDFLFLDFPQSNSSFAAEYLRLYGETPGPIEIQAFESATILRELISQGARSRNELQRRLAGLNRFPGVTGTLTMSEKREVARKLQFYKIDKNELVPIEE
ncbi:MAG: penicillin-binding protein activator [Pseudobdellovibrionaceae bacterium]